MESIENVSTSNSRSASELDECVTENMQNSSKSSDENLADLQEQVIANLQKPNVPNINVPEKIVICLDLCHDNLSTVFRLGDGSSFTQLNMFRRILDFFLHSKLAINKKTEFALIALNNNEAVWVQDFTNNLKEINNTLDHLAPEESKQQTFDFGSIYKVLKDKIQLPILQDNNITPPAYVVRTIVIYGRSNCLPVMPLEDDFFLFLKKHLYFYMDILLSHDEECVQNKCEEVYSALQDLDNGYSYVFEISKSAKKIHDCAAKLLAHPFQRPLQKNTDYKFGSAA